MCNTYKKRHYLIDISYQKTFANKEYQDLMSTLK